MIIGYIILFLIGLVALVKASDVFVDVRRTDYLTCPFPLIINFMLVSSLSPMGPLACSFWVEMPISAPSPNSPPSVKRVEAFTYTAAESTPEVNLLAAA